MRITLDDLEALYTAADRDVLDVIKGPAKGAERHRQLREILRCTEYLGGFCLGDKSPTQTLELAEARAPNLHETLLGLTLGNSIARSKYDQLRKEAEALFQERKRLEQANILIETRQQQLEHERKLLEQQRKYLELEAERLKQLPSSGTASLDVPQGEIRFSNPDEEEESL